METILGLHNNSQGSGYRGISSAIFAGAVAGASVPFAKKIISGSNSDGFVSSKAKDIGSLFQNGIDRIKKLFSKILPKKAAESVQTVTEAAEKPGILKRFFSTIKTKINDTGKAFIDGLSQRKKNVSDKIKDTLKETTQRIKNIGKPETSITKIISDFLKKSTLKYAAIGAVAGAVGYIVAGKLLQTLGIIKKEEAKTYIIKE